METVTTTLQQFNEADCIHPAHANSASYGDAPPSSRHSSKGSSGGSPRNGQRRCS